ncbi:response regulator [Telmatobacter sp. DSM 110680]|uniref:Response regulator n=1 Tax=Telmatobacter sp. DSM 110680 TaxID=3036704 RepID=A0AAU7DPQ2_9BACT
MDLALGDKSHSIKFSPFFLILEIIFTSCEVRNVKNISKATILFVDDEPCMRELMAMILNEEGFEVATATDGLDALIQLRSFSPDLIISDLQMPRMSGVEFLSVVRHRFPTVPVLAISGAFDTDEFSPAGVMADAFYPKSRCHPDELMKTVRDLMYLPLSRPTNYRPCQPPKVQTARITRNGNGNPVCLLTCTDCLRAFSCTGNESGHETEQATCQFCMTPVRFTRDVAAAPSSAIVSACGAVSIPAA